MVRGEATLVFRDINTGEITKEISDTNYVTEDQLNRMANCYYDVNSYGGSASPGRFGQYIFIGGLDQEHDRGWGQIWNLLERGTTESGITSPQLLYGAVGTGGTNARYYQYQQRFSPPAADRTIYTIAIGRDDFTSIPTYNRPLYCAAYIVLDTPCIQTTTETLDIFYRIIWDNPEENTSTTVPSGNAMYAIALRHEYGTTQYAYYPYNGCFMYHGRKMIPNVRGQWLWHGNRGIGTLDNNTSNYGMSAGVAYADTAYRARIMYAQFGLTSSLGQVVGSIYHTGTRNIGSEQEISALPNPAVPPNESPIQNIFSHGSTATGPFYSASTIPTGDGTLSVNGDSWTDPDYQKLLRIEVTGSGGVGVGTYKMWMRNTTGFINNTYEDNAVAIPFLNAYNNWYGVLFENGAYDTGGGRIWQGISAASSFGITSMAYDDTSTFVGWMHYMVMKYNVITGERVAFRSDTTPASNFTDISQLCIADNGDIWVADAQTGLHRIHADNTTIDSFDNTHVDLTGIANNECFGVAKTPGRIWAIMHDSLIFTNDNGASFTVYDSTTTPAFAPTAVGEERRSWFLQGDPNHADHRLAIGYNSYSTFSNIGQYCYLQIKWWDSVSGHGATTGNISNVSADGGSYPASTQYQRRRELFQFFHCSPNDGIWGSRRVYQTSGADDDSPGLWNFGATSPTYTYTPGTSDTIYSSGWIFWWAKDNNGDDALLWTATDSNQRFSLGAPDGTTHFAGYMQDEYSSIPSLGTDPYTYGFEIGMKAFFPGSGMFLFSDRRYTAGNRCWYLVSVSNNINSDSGAFKNVTWKEYGWDGVNWIEGNANSKTIHATDDALIDGLTVSFDDNAGAQTFVASDYYTVGVMDGVLLDGGTEIDTRYALYYKPVDFDLTDVEGGGVLPATTSDASRGLNETEISTMIDNFNTTYDAGNNRFQASSNAAWGTRLYGAMADQAYMQCRIIDLGNTAGYRHVYGMAAASKIGTSPAENDIDYAVRITSVYNYNWRIEVISNGSVVHTEYEPPLGLGNYEGEFNSQNDSDSYFRFNRKPGTTDLEIRARNKIIYTFTGVTGSLIPTIWASYNSGYHYWNSMSTTYTDYHVELGNSVALTGKFDPNFWAIDYTLPGRPDGIKIDGVPVTTILVNDYGRTPLASGEIEILTYQGKIRYAAADAGKTLTIDRYNAILHE